MNNQFDKSLEAKFDEIFSDVGNQCDGCAAGIKKTEFGMRISESGRPLMACVKQTYEKLGE